MSWSHNFVFTTMVLASVVCQNSYGYSNVDDDVVCVLSHVTNQCGARRLVIITDEIDNVSNPMFRFLSGSSLVYTVYNVFDAGHQEIYDIIDHNSDSQVKSPSTFLLMTSRFRDVLEAAENHFHEVNRKRGSIAPHSVKWLVFLKTELELNDLIEEQKNSTYDHLAALYLGENDTLVKVYTFMWRENRTRTPDLVELDSLQNKNPECLLFPNTKYGLNGRHLMVLTKVHWGFFVAIRNNTLTGMPEYHGFILDVIDALIDSMNFTYTALPLPSGEQISWDEYANIIIKGDVDLGLTTWSYSWGCVHNISFTYPVVMDTYTGIYRRNLPANEFNSFFIVCPFNPYTYVFLILSCAYTSLLYVFIVGFVYPHEKDEKFRPLGLFSVDRKKRKGVANSRGALSKALANRMSGTAWTFVASVMNQAYLPRPKQMSARVLLFLWSLAIVMFYAIYTGSLTAEMVARPKEAPFKSFQEMVSMGDYNWGTIEESIVHKLMNHTNDGIIAQLSDGASNVPDADLGDVYDTLTYMLEDLEDDYVFIHFHSLLNQIRAVSKFPGHFNFITEPLSSANQGFIGPLNSELCELFSRYIHKLHSSGLMQKVYDAYTSGNGTTAEEMDEKESKRTNVMLEDMRWPFSIVSGVLVLCASVLAVEKLFALLCNDDENEEKKENPVIP